MSHHPLAQMVAAGTRLTAQRQLIWDLLHQSEEHLTAEQIRARLAGRLPGLNLPTVYLTLVFLRPTILLFTILSIIWDFNVFNQIWLVSQGGPGNATTTMVVYLYEQGFQFYGAR